ncbi:Com family DNA-binding transcriptional regulator [Bordetella bronchialis]|uniref:Com family DNA-binding transcriptional regulator n=1 Tax=Bordetella bronchialis TaxID=463025 RepID=UPI003D06C6FD
MDDFRCGNCRRKLAEGLFISLRIKCPRCGTFNHASAASVQNAERHGASNQEMLHEITDSNGTCRLSAQAHRRR